MKTVFNNDELVHVWAQNNQEEGRNAKNTFSFHFGHLYSYTTKIADIIELKNNTVALFTTERYSQTTDQQQSKAEQAARHLTCFTVPNLVYGWDKKIDHKGNLAYFKEQVKEHILKSARARKNKSFLFSQAEDFVKQHNDYLNAFKIKRKVLSIEQFDVESIKSAAAKSRAKELKREKAARAAIVAANKENLNEWLNNETNHLNAARNYGCILRVKKDRTVESSQGVTIQEKTAFKLWVLVQKVKSTGAEWISGPEQSLKIEYYTLDKISKNGDIKAGCHSIKYSELLKAANKLGFRTIFDKTAEA